MNDPINEQTTTAINPACFVPDMTEQFKDGLTDMLHQRSDTFSFEFPLGAAPDWELRNEAMSAGMSTDTTMTVVVLIRPKTIADEMLRAMSALRDSMAAAQTQNAANTLQDSGDLK